MFLFRGFRASLSLSDGNKHEVAASYDSTNLSTAGAYRANREEFFGIGSLSHERKKISPSMVKLPPSIGEESNNSSDVTGTKITEPLSKSTPNISMNPNGDDHHRRAKNKDEIKIQKKIEKQRANEQKKMEKEMRDREKAQREKEKAQREREKALRDKENKKKKIKAPEAPKQTQAKTSENPLAASINRTSGPPPYEQVLNESNVPKARTRSKVNKDGEPDNSDNTGNISFSKPVDDASSWDLVTQHRERTAQIRPIGQQRRPKHMVMDLNFNMAKDTNSEA